MAIGLQQIFSMEYGKVYTFQLIDNFSDQRLLKAYKMYLATATVNP
jgi:hypothetical protein